MSRVKNASRNIIWGILNKIVVLLLPFITRTVMIYTLGMEYVGLNSLFTSILQVLSFAELGIGSALVFSMYEPMAENDDKKIKKKADLSIAMMHHPSDWLTKNEQKYLTRYMTDEYRLNTNIMLQGHIHEKETYNWYNQNHSITTLVTGMGWDQQQKINDNGHRYSLYQINMDSGIVKVKSYVTDRSGTFEEDTSLYNGRNIVFPLYVHKFLELNNWYFKNSEISLFYPKYNSADSLKDISDKLNDFCINMMKFLEEMRIDTVLFKQVNELSLIHI